MAKNLRSSKDLQQTLMGTPLYIAPEIFKETGYNCKADVWSLGVIIYEIMNLESPFLASNFQELIQGITEK